MYKGGYTGKTVWINLTKRQVDIQPTDPEMAQLYLGGAGFGIKILYDHVKPNTDPLSPDNLLIFSPGPLTGTDSPCSSRMTVTARSPLTGAVGMATSGGQFPVAMKQAGFDIIVVQGEASESTYLTIEDGQVSFHSARKLWGTNTQDCQAYLQEELPGSKYRIACIGQAGEKQSLTACIVNERRAAARKGLGAVMGSKRLKAIAVCGDTKIRVAEPQRFRAAMSEILKRFKANPGLYKEFSRHGSSSNINNTAEMGIFPANNYSGTGLFNGIEDIGYDIQDADVIRRNPCYKCPVGCTQVRIANSGDFQGVLTEGPEFETSWAFGGNTGVSDISALYLADRLCDEYGLDTISVGSTIAFAMELFERRIISTVETDGLELTFGNHQAMIKAIHLIGLRKGFGAILADGVVQAAQKIGRGSERYAMHVKGLELPGYDVRGAKAQGLNYATAYTGADHNRGYAFQEIFGLAVPFPVNRLDIKEASEVCKWNQIMEVAVCDCPTFCSFLISEGLLKETEPGLDSELDRQRLETISEIVSAATGMAFTPDALIEIGERVNTLARCFNLREGFSRKDDYLPDRLAEEPIPDGPSKGSFTPRELQDKMLDRYYEVYGYDMQGIPTKDRLVSLGLSNVVSELKSLGLKLQ
jgi:aldehyde:ferredoxin oxidoreductase